MFFHIFLTSSQFRSFDWNHFASVKQDTVMEAIGQVLSSRRGIWIDEVTGHCRLIGSTLQCWPLYTCVYVYIYIYIIYIYIYPEKGWIRDPCLWARGVHNSKIVCAHPYRPVAFPRVKKFLGAEKVLPGKVLCWAREALLKYQLWICRSGWGGKNARSSWLLLQKLCFGEHVSAAMLRKLCFGSDASETMLRKLCADIQEGETMFRKPSTQN